MNTEENKNFRYFAAANGYSGFRSQFDKIFAPSDFEHIYVLKGGPGTGKSTLMRKVAAKFSGRVGAVEEIFCSSDPASLDGLIIKANGRAVAILDGTAPHERDASCPGAVDEIINLAEGIDTGYLRGERSRIEELMKNKRLAYKRAYSHLNVAGAVYDCVNSVFSNLIDYYRAECIAEEISSLIPRGDLSPKPSVYTSSFNRFGYSELPIFTAAKSRKISITGDGFREHFLMRIIAQKLSAKGALERISLSPLTDRITDKIFTEDTLIEVSNSPSADFDTTDISGYRPGQLTELHTEHARSLFLAQDAFGEAAEHHNELEKIYKKAVDFSLNDKTTEKIIIDISTYLGIGF